MIKFYLSVLITIAFSFPLSECQTNFTKCPFQIDNSCQCNNISIDGGSILVYCKTQGPAFPQFPSDSNYGEYVTTVIVEGNFEELPAYAFGDLLPYKVSLIRNPENTTFPLAINDTCFSGTFGPGTWTNYIYTYISFENFLGLNEIPTKALATPIGIDQIYFSGSNFSTIKDNSFLNVFTSSITLDNCNIASVEQDSFVGIKSQDPVPEVELFLTNNRLTKMPMLPLSRLNKTLTLLDVSGNLLTKLSDAGFENFCCLRNFQFDYNPIEFIALNSLNNVQCSELNIENLPVFSSLDVSITIDMPDISVLNITNCSALTTLEISNYQLPGRLQNIYSPPSVRYINENFKRWLSFQTFNVLHMDSSEYACDNSMMWMKPFMCSQTDVKIVTTGDGVNAQCSNGQSIETFVCATASSAILFTKISYFLTVLPFVFVKIIF